MSRPSRQNRVVQMQQEMTQQEQIIERRKKEIMEKLSGQSQPSVEERPGASGASLKNTFSNDGSFLENFKKLTQAASYIEQNPPTEETSEVPLATSAATVITPPPEQDNDPSSTPVLSDKPNTVQELVEMVVAAGEGGETVIEERLRTRKNLPRQLWFLFDLNSSEYRSYRSQVDAARASPSSPAVVASVPKKVPIAASPSIIHENGNGKQSQPHPDYGQFVTVHRGNIYRDEDDENTEDSDTEYRREAKERNLKNMKNRMVCQYDSDSSSSDQMEPSKYEGSRFNHDNFPSHSHAAEKMSNNDSGSSAIPSKKRRKSRWDSEAAAAAAANGKVSTTSTAPVAAAVSSSSTAAIPEKKTKVDRSNPEVIKLAVNSFGSVDLDEDQWQKVEEQFLVQMVYNEMLAKRKEIDRLAKSGRFKYEYDSDEDLEGGTWEHKLRKAEMESTKNWAETTTAVNNNRHHIGDFLPPDELKKFLEQHDKKKNKDSEPATDYQDKKLTEDNKGFQMLQKLGWKDGEGLGASGSGIVNPVNKSAAREANQGLGVNSACSPEEDDNEYDAYRKRMMLAYRFRPNPMNNPRRAYY